MKVQIVINDIIAYIITVECLFLSPFIMMKICEKITSSRQFDSMVKKFAQKRLKISDDYHSAVLDYGLYSDGKKDVLRIIVSVTETDGRPDWMYDDYVVRDLNVTPKLENVKKQPVKSNRPFLVRFDTPTRNNTSDCIKTMEEEKTLMEKPEDGEGSASSSSNLTPRSNVSNDIDEDDEDNEDDL
jgi:hypothetical protein